MRRITIILLFTLIAGSGSLLGQQLPQFTQYMFNDFVINPAIAGTGRKQAMLGIYYYEDDSLVEDADTEE